MLNKFVIASIQRSGTTVLKDLLASHPQISSNQEILKNAVFQRDHGISLIEGLPCNNACKALGFKLMLNQIDANVWLMDYLAGHNFKVILLHRKPLIDIYLSHEIAKRDNRWSIDRNVEVEPIEIDLTHMKSQLTLIHESQLRLDELFKGFDVFKMTYDTVNDENFHSRLLTFLGVNNDLKLNTNQKRVLRKSRRHYISNYDEVMAQVGRLDLDIRQDSNLHQSGEI